MKKLLVILMLGAGFVTTASAGPRNCLPNDLNQCCIDVSNIQSAINQNSPAGITTKDGYKVLNIEVDLTNDATSSATTVCIDRAFAIKDGGEIVGVFAWVPGKLAGTIVKYNNPSSSSNKSAARRIITNN